jgi:hypothetical protein
MRVTQLRSLIPFAERRDAQPNHSSLYGFESWGREQEHSTPLLFRSCKTGKT